MSGWLEYFHAATRAWLADQVTRGLLPASVAERGWKAALSKALVVADVQVSRWANGDRIPDVDSCRALARVWGVTPVEVLVAAGHLDPEDARMPARPTAPAPRDSPHLARLAEVLRNPETTPERRAQVEAILSAAASLAEGYPPGNHGNPGVESRGA